MKLKIVLSIVVFLALCSVSIAQTPKKTLSSVVAFDSIKRCPILAENESQLTAIDNQMDELKKQAEKLQLMRSVVTETILRGKGWSPSDIDEKTFRETKTEFIFKLKKPN